ncbi:PTS glucose transporter subunit IIA [Mycoplasmopsis glycophila]|uniref:Phosphotransferase system, EIIB n=1 Tax=Mycoplasmopsis glycophila TaxID=171285 RepID=A0A449AUW5_9BACT|nr:PTS glucose transporter subunit IIA [Mycoplasmopsis glycophila]VEU70309.1 Phosphotransferase system, EIIB [Mycoplasmopsis glycophila]
MKLVDKFEVLAKEYNEKNQIPNEVKEVVEALGGVNNILSFNNSVSELRYDLKDLSLVNEAALKDMGATKIVMFDRERHVQICFGVGTEIINQLIKKYLSKLKEESTSETQEAKKEDCKCSDKEEQVVSSLEVIAPVSGKVISLEELNDGVFSAGLVGKGFAIEMDLAAGKVEVLAPFSGKIAMMPATKNQILLSASNGAEVVLLLGQDSHKLDGIGFDAHYGLNSFVEQGKSLVTLDLNRFKSENIDNKFVFVLTQDSKFQTIEELVKEAKSGQKLFQLVK